MRGWLIGLISVAATACGAAPPRALLTESEASLRAAKEVGASQHPKAALHLKMAEDQLGEGKRFMDDGDNQLAAEALERARADAELAIEITRSKTAQAEAAKATERLKSLRNK
ncbi:MAG: DUF4398 domain-containing protein [Myxococcota bacterium]